MTRPAYLVLAVSASGCLLHRSPALPAPIPRVDGERHTAFALHYIDVKIGTGAALTPRKCVFANYTGWLTDGKNSTHRATPRPRESRAIQSAFPKARDA